MKSIKTELEHLTKLLSELERDPVVPKRFAIVAERKRNKMYYMNVKTSDGKRTYEYIGNSDSDRLCTMARASYKKELLQIVKHDIKVLKNAIDNFQQYGRAGILAKLSPCLSNVEFDMEFDADMKELKRWAEEEYEKNSKPFQRAVIRAKDGTRVRSRAECIIYNMLLDIGIPFRYDPVLKLKIKNEYGEIEEIEKSPDFLIKCPDGSLTIIEHAGLLTSKQYALDLANKLQLYQLNGYSLGYSLFVTGEDADGGIDSQVINDIINCVRLHFAYL